MTLMLILTRRIGETLWIGEDVKITVLAHRGSHVKIGIRAPKSVAVHRAEVFERIQQTCTETAAPSTAEAITSQAFVSQE
jgi:carbon storage regulator